MQHLPFRAVSGGGAVGVQDEPPLPAVYAHIVMKLAQGDAIGDRCRAAVALVPQMMDIAVRQGTAAAGPLAVPGAELDGATDGTGDLIGMPDVEDDRLAVELGVAAYEGSPYPIARGHLPMYERQFRGARLLRLSLIGKASMNRA